MKCRHCDAPKATMKFNLQLCCEGRKKRRIWLCEECDAELQRRIVAFLNLKPRGSAHADR